MRTVFSVIFRRSLQAMHDDVATRVRFNAVVDTGVPGFVPRPRDR